MKYLCPSFKEKKNEENYIFSSITHSVMKVFWSWCVCVCMSEHNSNQTVLPIKLLIGQFDINHCCKYFIDFCTN